MRAGVVTQQVVEAAGARSGRVEDAPRVVADETRMIFHPERLDVLVHLRALERLSGGDSAWVDDGVDWVATSDALAADDVEPSVGELAARLASADAYEHEVVFGIGGRLVAGATSAAASIYGGLPIRRRNRGVRGLDRSQSALERAGFTPTELRGAIETWLRRDPGAAFIVIDHDTHFAEAALAEVERRYEVFHSEFEHLSDDDAGAAGLATGGSVHLLAVRVSGATVDAVVDRHREAVLGAFLGDTAAGVARAVYDPDRDVSSSPGHARALRARRRSARQAQAIAALRALRS